MAVRRRDDPPPDSWPSVRRGADHEPLERPVYVPLPAEALTEAVATADDLLELKVIVAALRALARKRAGARWVTPREVMQDPGLARALAAEAPERRSELVAAALQRACQHDILACARGGAEATEPRFTQNREAERKALEEAGWTIVDEALPWPAESPPAMKSGIFELYEQNIGLVTPLLADELREAERTYPPEWVEEAFREAVGYNKRNWRYIRRILENWATEGKGTRGATWRRAEAARNRRRNLGGRFGTSPG